MFLKSPLEHVMIVKSMDANSQYMYINAYIYIYCQKKMAIRDILPFQKKKTNLSETIHYIPKVLRKGNPFHGPFAKFSYIYIYIYI